MTAVKPYGYIVRRVRSYEVAYAHKKKSIFGWVIFKWRTEGKPYIFTSKEQVELFVEGLCESTNYRSLYTPLGWDFFSGAWQNFYILPVNKDGEVIEEGE